MSRRSANLALLLASVLVSLLVFEVAARLLGLSWPVFYRPDAALGEVPIPNAEGWDRFENPVYVRFNRFGMRDRERSLDKPTGSFRIALLGDSYVEAKQVHFEATAGAVLERELSGCPALDGRAVEVLNFGVAGYGTTQELLMFEERARRFSPDLVVLAFFWGNDVRNNSIELQGASKPHFVDRDGTLVLDRSFARGLGNALRMSALGRAFYERAPDLRVIQLALAAARARREREAAARRAEEQRRAAVRVTTPGFEPGLDHQIYLEPLPSVWEHAWSLTERILARLAARVRESGADFLLVSFGSGIEVHPDPAVRAAFASALGVRDLEAPARRLASVAAREAIEHLPLVPALRAHAEQTGQCVHGFVGALPCGGHWNERGHRVAGTQMARAVCQRLERAHAGTALPLGRGDPTLPAIRA